MAKIFRTESLSLNADFIRLTADSSENFEFKNSSGSIIMSRATIESDISSLALDGRNQDSDVSSLASGLTQEEGEQQQMLYCYCKLGLHLLTQNFIFKYRKTLHHKNSSYPFHPASKNEWTL